MAIAGNFETDLHFSTNKKDIDWVMKLYEQLPDGRYVALSETVQRSSLADNPSKRKLLIPGKAVQLHFNKTPVSGKWLATGSRLVFVMGINSSPFWEINYGTGREVSREKN